MKRLFVFHGMFWLGAVGFACTGIGLLEGSRSLLVPMLVFGSVALAGFLLFAGTVVSLMRRGTSRPPRGRGPSRRFSPK